MLRVGACEVDVDLLAANLDRAPDLELSFDCLDDVLCADFSPDGTTKSRNFSNPQLNLTFSTIPRPLLLLRLFYRKTELPL